MPQLLVQFELVQLVPVVQLLELVFFEPQQQLQLQFVEQPQQLQLVFIVFLPVLEQQLQLVG